VERHLLWEQTPEEWALTSGELKGILLWECTPEEWALTSGELKGILLREQTSEEWALTSRELKGIYFGNRIPEEWALTSQELKGLLLWEQTPEEEADIPKERAHSLGVYFGNKRLRRRLTFPKKEPMPLRRLLRERLRSRTFLKKEPTPRAFTLGTPEEEVIPKVSSPKWPFNLSSIPKVSTALGLLRRSQSKCTLTPPGVSTYFRNASSPSPYTYRGSAP
jgi:hypothetical protein